MTVSRAPMTATRAVLTSDHRLPLYQQLKEMFLQEIRQGTWKTGATIPSELEIAKRFSLSRATVRQALTDLVQTGYLRRIQGKGTIVTEPKIEPLAALTSFSENMKAAGIVPTRRTLAVEWKVPTPDMAETLRQPGGQALYVERVLIGNGRPLALQRSWYPARLVEEQRDLFTKEYLDHNSIYETLQTRCGAVLHTADETIDVGMPNKAEMKLLELRSGQPVMIIHRNTFDPFLRTIESVELLFRSDRYRYRVTLTRLALKTESTKADDTRPGTRRRN
jgi:GntR family transcriptional regulator